MRALPVVVAIMTAACADRAYPVAVCSDAESATLRADVIRVSDDPNNCGCIGNVCPPATGEHALSVCAAGVCRQTCEAGWGECDGDLSNGCETSLRTRTDHCGACGVACRPSRATPTCADGRCMVGQCEPGTADCDGVVENGCEVSTSDDVSNCGGCGARCAPVRGSGRCVDGRCEVASCDAGFRNCNGLATDGCEVSAFTDVTNCGGCGVMCRGSHAQMRCVSGGCEVASCEAGYRDCNGFAADGCEVDTASSASNCGGCSTPSNSFACGAGRTCVSSRCVCVPGLTECSGQCVNLQTSSGNCGRCGNVCPGERQCISGSCQCPSGTSACGNFCRGCGSDSVLRCSASFAVCCLRSGTGFCDNRDAPCWNEQIACNTITRCPNLMSGWGGCRSANQRVQCNPYACVP